jgi:hypothetical protein
MPSASHRRLAVDTTTVLVSNEAQERLGPVRIAAAA